MEQYLIDSNVVIDYLAGQLPELGMTFMNRLMDNVPQISVITQIEILGYNTSAEAQELLAGFIRNSRVLPLNDDVVSRTILLRKNYRIKIPDAIIAATALEFECILLTRNSEDFKAIAGLTYRNLHQ